MLARCHRRGGRLAEELPADALGRDEPGHVFSHLLCAAQKKAKILKPALDAYPGEVPGREALVEAMEAAPSKSTRARKPKAPPS